MYRLRLIPDKTAFPFMNGRNIGLAVSAFLSIASILLFFWPGLNLGIDFRGGVLIELRTPQAAQFEELRTTLGGLGFGEVGLQQYGSPQDVLIRIDQQPGGEEAQQRAVARVRDAVGQRFPGSEIRRVEAVGATVSGELYRAGMTAMGLALVAMLAYIAFRFQWPFGVGAVVTLILDVTKLVGVYVLLKFQFNLDSIAAILTVMGFSINDKVVVYDRVRENLRKYKSMPLRQLIDQSINEILNRTVNVSLTVFLSTVPLVFGGEAVREFALIILIGLVIGTSSSIFIAAPILLYLGEGRLRRGAAPVVDKTVEAARP
jgi:preprotein translocase subunit SecF